MNANLERFKKYCGQSVGREKGSGLFGFWLRFGSVTGHCGHAPSPKRGLPKPATSQFPQKRRTLRDPWCQNPKILAPTGHTIS